jgi:sulfotransferase
MNILGNHPDYAVTPTSGLIELFNVVKNVWKQNNEFKAQGLENIKPRVLEGMKGLMEGYFEKDFKEGKTVAFDKSRGWMAYTEVLEEVFQRPVKVIVTVRDIRAIVASFEKMYQKKGIEHMESQGEDFIKSQSIHGRAEILLRDNNIVGLPIVRLRDALNRASKKNIIVVPFLQLTNKPKETMDNLHDLLGLEKHDYDFNNIKQVTYEDDNLHGWKDLHTINPKVTGSMDPSWTNIIPEEMANNIGKAYQDINKIANNF